MACPYLRLEILNHRPESRSSTLAFRAMTCGSMKISAGSDGLDKRLSRAAHQDGKAEPLQFPEVCEDFKVLRSRLAETQAGVKDQLGFAQPRRQSALERARESSIERLPNIPHEGHRLHRLWPAAQVHQDEGSLVATRHVGQARIKSQSADVVQDTGSGLRRLFRHLGFRGVNRDGSRAQFTPKAPDNRQNPP